MRSATSSRGRAAISFWRAVSFERILSTAGRAEVSENAVKSAMDQPASFTARDSGRSRLPWQTLQRVAGMEWRLYLGEGTDPEVFKCRLRDFRVPGKQQ